MEAAVNLVTMAEFAELAGIEPATLRGLCRGALKPATHGTRIDLSHKRVIDYFDQRTKLKNDDPLYSAFLALWNDMGENATTQAIADTLQAGQRRVGDMYRAAVATGDIKPIVKHRDKPGPLGALERRQRESLKDIPHDLSELMTWTLGEIIAKWGTATAFLDWLRATKMLEDIQEKQLKNAEKSGVLISRDIVKRGIIDPIDSAHIKLLTDGVKTVAKRAMAMTSAGRPQEDIEKFVGDQIGSFLRPLKAKISRALKHA